MRRDPLNIKFVIPATPGFFSLSPLFDKSGKVVVGATKEPIVGWAIDQYNCVCHVTPDFVDADATATLNPDGTVQDVTGSWETLDDWVDEQKTSATG